MNDLLESSRLFSASAALASAASALRQINRRSLSEAERQELLSAATFLQQVDWSATPKPATALNTHTTSQATKVRPLFYHALLEIQRQFGEAGITTADDAKEFLATLYSLLIAPSEHKKTEEKSIGLAADFLERISQGLLTQLTNNGLPRHSEMAMFAT